MSDELPTLTSRDQLAELELDYVRAVGRYEEYDARMRKTGDPVYAGHALVRLDDGTGVLLEPVWEPRARRDEAERRELAGKRVAVNGLLFAEAPPSYDHPGAANLLMPCLSDIKSVELASGE